MKNLFCEDGNSNKACVRRVMGVIGFGAYIFGCMHPAINTPALSPLGFISASLLGLTTVDKFIK